MADELSLQKDVTRAGKAKALLENELLMSAYDDIEAALIQKIINTNPEDSEDREMSWHMIRANRRHRELLQSYVASGSLASAELEKLHADAERRKKFGLI